LRAEVHFSFFQRWQKTIDIPSIGEDPFIDRRVGNFAVVQGWDEEADRPGGINEGGLERISDLGLALSLLSHVFEETLIPGPRRHFEDAHPHGGIKLVLHDRGYDGDGFIGPFLYGRILKLKVFDFQIGSLADDIDQGDEMANVFIGVLDIDEDHTILGGVVKDVMQHLVIGSVNR
jgi:hypothetical protein